MLIRDPPECRASYWKLIEEIIAQVVLDGKGIDPDFTKNYRLNVDSICKNFARIEKLDLIEKNYKSVSSQMAEMTKEKLLLESEIKGFYQINQN
jgi:hypothetical protein